MDTQPERPRNSPCPVRTVISPHFQHLFYIFSLLNPSLTPSLFFILIFTAKAYSYGKQGYDDDDDGATGYSNESTPYYVYSGGDSPVISSSDDEEEEEEDSETEDVQQTLESCAISNSSPQNPP